MQEFYETSLKLFRFTAFAVQPVHPALARAAAIHVALHALEPLLGADAAHVLVALGALRVGLALIIGVARSGVAQDNRWGGFGGGGGDTH